MTYDHFSCFFFTVTLKYITSEATSGFFNKQRPYSTNVESKQSRDSQAIFLAKSCLKIGFVIVMLPIIEHKSTLCLFMLSHPLTLIPT